MQTSQPAAPTIRSFTAFVRYCSLGLVGVLSFNTGCFSSGLSSLSGVAAPAERLSPTDPTTLHALAPIASERSLTQPRWTHGSNAARESQNSPARDPTTGLLIPPRPQDLPPVPINREVN